MWKFQLHFPSWRAQKMTRALLRAPCFSIAECRLHFVGFGLLFCICPLWNFSTEELLPSGHPLRFFAPTTVTAFPMRKGQVFGNKEDGCRQSRFSLVIPCAVQSHPSVQSTRGRCRWAKRCRGRRGILPPNGAPSIPRCQRRAIRRQTHPPTAPPR